VRATIGSIGTDTPELTAVRITDNNMGDLSPLAIDIETDGLDPGSVITVVGIASGMGAWLALNTGGRTVDDTALETELRDRTDAHVELAVVEDEQALLEALTEVCEARIDGDRHYVTAYFGEVWDGGFDFPHMRTACVRQNVEWPFTDVAYADVTDMMDRFDTGDANDLEGVYEELIGTDHGDPFADSGAAVEAFREGDWVNLLLHNYYDIKRTRELAVLAGRFIAKSDFRMKNLEPPDR